MKRGEIWTAAIGHGFGSKPRPVIIVQADDLIDAPVLLVIPLTTFEDGPPIRPVVEPDDGNGLAEVSAVMVDRVMPISRDKFGRKAGAISVETLQTVERAMMVVLGLTRSAR